MSEYGHGATAAPAKLVFYAHCEVEPLRALRLIDDVSNEPIGMCYMGAFLNPRLYCEIAAVNAGARRILTFDGEVNITSDSPDSIADELRQILIDSMPSAQLQNSATERLAEQNRQVAARHNPSIADELRQILIDSMPSAQLQNSATERLAEQNRQVAARHNPVPKGAPRPKAEPKYRGYTQAEWDEYNRSRRRGQYSQAEWDAWNRSRY
eukprot:s2166_g9.t1